MIVYHKKDFLKLSKGTLFCSGKPWIFGPLCLKGESIENDFYYTNLCWVNHYHDVAHMLTESLRTGYSLKMNAIEQRNGLYDDDQVFLVFEKDDLFDLRGLCGKELINLGIHCL